MWSSLWYPSACTAMAELALAGTRRERPNDIHPCEQRRTRPFAPRSDEKRSKTAKRSIATWRPWIGMAIRTIMDMRITISRLSRGIASESESQRILDWLDHGQFSPDGGTTWHDDIYSLWQIAPPFLTVNNRDWQGLGGMPGGFPYGSVLGAGGTRLLTAAVDLERGSNAGNRQCLATRSADPRSLRASGSSHGRSTFDDPGGRGRWHFGPPDLERADIEGFREISPTMARSPQPFPAHCSD